ncbi:MAG: phosphoribosylamine--glycine ligase [Myxococcales bacterium]|nr:phosphoribosylamine--glycine ligase [Myxococcales bacterium]
MKVLVIGSGGREHALCYRLAKSASVSEVLCAPGNPGTARCGENVAVDATDLDGLVALARERAVDLTVVGPEAPLCAGIADRFAEAGLLLLGPSAAAAQLEGSKIFAKELMQRAGVATAAFAVVEDLAQARAALGADPTLLVVKADGLAAGKGVIVCDDSAGALAACEEMFAGKLGDAGARVLLERKLEGEEVSVIALSDGERVVALASAQDHKRALDGDRGPNTGGMGAYSPAPVLDEALAARVQREVLEPVVARMRTEGAPYRGVLYAGLMICGGDPQVLEFNCRFGDPETQPLMARFSGDLATWLAGAARGELPPGAPSWDPRAAICVVLAAEGYPGAYQKGHAIEGVEAAEALDDVIVMHAGTTRDAQGVLRTAGGRVLGVTALGDTLAAAQQRVYEAADKIGWPGRQMRRDIGFRALAREDA